MFTMANIFLSSYWKTENWRSKNKTGTTVPLVSERVMIQFLSRQKCFHMGLNVFRVRYDLNSYILFRRNQSLNSLLMHSGLI
jgi:hypothetical protein